MTQLRWAVGNLVFLLALASMAVTACGREPGAQQAGASASTGPSPSLASTTLTTPGQAMAEECSAMARAESAVCLAPTDEAAPIARAPGGGARVATAASRRAHAAVPLPPPVDRSGGDLDRAIAARIAEDDRRRVLDEPATPGDETGAQVTTTSATVARAAPAFAPARVSFDNRLPADYRLERVRLLVDGAVSFDGKGALSVEVAPGDHVVEVIADYRLDDPVFTYVRDYHVALESTEVVPASRAPIAFVATARPSGGVTAPMNKRAALAWRSFPVR